MAIEYRKKTAVFQGLVGVDEAEGLLEWLQKKPGAKVHLADCTHMHPANLQVLIVARPDIVSWPEAKGFRAWIEPVLKQS